MTPSVQHFSYLLAEIKENFTHRREQTLENWKCSQPSVCN